MEKIINVNGFLLKVDFSKNKRIEVIGTKRKGIEIIKKFEEGHLGSTYLIDFYGKKAVLKFPKYYNDSSIINFQFKNYFFSNWLIKKLKINNIHKVYESNIVKISNLRYTINSKYFVPYLVLEFIEGQKIKNPSEEEIKKLAYLIANIHAKTKDKFITKINSNKANKIIKIKKWRFDTNYFKKTIVSCFLEYKKNKEYLRLINKLLNNKSFSKIIRENYFYTALVHGDLSFNNVLLNEKNIYLIDPSYNYIKESIFLDLSKLYRYFKIKDEDKKYKIFIDYYSEFLSKKLNKEVDREILDFLTRLHHIKLSMGTLWYFKVELKQKNEFLEKVEQICDEDYELINKTLLKSL